jgi:phosphotransferase system enzyme I (PtsP)
MGADIQPSLLHGHTLIVDGYRGELLVDPEPVLLQEYQRLISEENELSRLAEDDLERASELKSGERVKVMLNAGLSPEHEEKLGNFVDGIGLYRTEIPFMLQSGFPSEEEQVAQYQGMLQMFNEKSVTLRTLDIGADKQLPYMPISEENPCLAGAVSGSRSISRRSFWYRSAAAGQRGNRKPQHPATDGHQPG